MNCCLCENRHDDGDEFFHTHIKGFAVCYCCEDDMNDDTRAAFNSFIENLIRQVPDKSEIYKSSLV